MPTGRVKTMLEAWRRVDDWGLHAAYTYDHLTWRSFREDPWYALVPTLAAAAASTTRVRLGPLVTTPNLRHPVVLTKELQTLDHLSNGRLSVGVGAGGTGYDATAFGAAPLTSPERHARFVDFTETLVHLLANRIGDIATDHFVAHDTRQIPSSLQRPRPPLYISGLGPKSIDLAARLGDGWVTIGSSDERSTLDAVRRQIDWLATARSRHGVTDHFEKILLDMHVDEHPLASLEAFLDWAGRYAALGITEVVVHYPVPDSPFDADLTTFEAIATTGRELVANW